MYYLIKPVLLAGPVSRDGLRMQNDAGEFVDLYVLRKCSASNRIIAAKDHASIQMNVAAVDRTTGRFNGQFKTYGIFVAIRRMGKSDDSILWLAKADGIVSKNFWAEELRNNLLQIFWGIRQYILIY